MAVEEIGMASQSVVMSPTVMGTQISAASTNKKVAEQPEAEVKTSTQNSLQSRNNSSGALDEKSRKAIEKLNSNMGKTECRYSFHENTNRVMIRIVDKETEEVIKEFPAEDTLNMIAKVWELAGLLVDEKL